MLQRKLQHLSSAVAFSTIAAAGLTLAATKPVLAEFEIKEAGIEKGEVELEYRGAYHWGLPKPGGAGQANGAAALEEESEVEKDGEEVPLRQSHDFELQMGITERWMISTTLGTIVPEGSDWRVASVDFETQYEFIERRGNGVGLAFTVGYGLATQAEEPDELEFGPIVELASGKVLVTLNPFFTAQLGEFATTDGLGFQYGWRGEYDLNERWGIGVEMFGEIKDLANAGSFNDQVHSIGPTLFFKPGGNKDEDDDPAGQAKVGTTTTGRAR
jgi:hypothetical protein